MSSSAPRPRVLPAEASQRTSQSAALMAAAAPLAPQDHLVEVPGLDGGLVFSTPDSRVHRFRGANWLELAQRWQQEQCPSGATSREAEAAESQARQSPTPLRALSLAVAQKCNLGCTYCYAQQGDFGQPARQMDLPTALLAVDRLLAEARSGDTVTLAFMGGEPLLNRPVIQAATYRAAALAAAAGVRVHYSITTNGTLLRPEDGELFERYGFAVTISLDGLGAVHDRLRPTKTGAGTFDRILARVRPLLEMQQAMQVSARVTVTPENLDLHEMLEAFVAMGFHSVGFSPLLAAPQKQGEMDHAALEHMLAEMVVCGLRFEKAMVEGRRFPFLNMVNAMREIHRGSRRHLPCGAGAGYLGVGADGSLAACHRFVGDEDRVFGALAAGPDGQGLTAWQEERNVDRQEPCRSCWARYLCGGGCHYEVLHRGRTACDFIRGWLHYCLQAYARLRERRPDYFGVADA